MAARPPAPHHGSTDGDPEEVGPAPASSQDRAGTRSPALCVPPWAALWGQGLSHGKAAVTAALDLLSLPMSTRLV